MVKNIDRRENQERFMQKLCSIVKVFDHNMGLKQNLNKIMLYYQDKFKSHCAVNFLIIALSMQSS